MWPHEHEVHAVAILRLLRMKVRDALGCATVESKQRVSYQHFCFFLDAKVGT